MSQPVVDTLQLCDALRKTWRREPTGTMWSRKTISRPDSRGCAGPRPSNETQAAFQQARDETQAAFEIRARWISSARELGGHVLDARFDAIDGRLKN